VISSRLLSDYNFQFKIRVNFNSPLAEIIGFQTEMVAVKEFSLSGDILELRPSDLHSVPSIRVFLGNYEDLAFLMKVSVVSE
jgi:hypothetical protein